MGRGMALPPPQVTSKTYLQLTLIQDQQNISWGPGRRAEESCGTGRSFTQALTGSELHLKNEQTPETEQRKDICP